jgi:hypothetical protein
VPSGSGYYSRSECQQGTQQDTTTTNNNNNKINVKCWPHRFILAAHTQPAATTQLSQDSGQQVDSQCHGRLCTGPHLRCHLDWLSSSADLHRQQHQLQRHGAVVH